MIRNIGLQKINSNLQKEKVLSGGETASGPSFRERDPEHVSRLGHAASLRRFLGSRRFCVQIFASFGFEHFDLPKALAVHWFGFGCPGGLGGLWGDSRGGGEALAPGTSPEDVDVLDLATTQLGGIGTSGSYLQVDFFNPPR